ncbi:hypothetical protein AFLA_013765 [Aspergillus flavus NRRL3357]|nr:hypothetical protein AFLA_013765 [Aspergillus flavus NRRL3357]
MWKDIKQKARSSIVTESKCMSKKTRLTPEPDLEPDHRSRTRMVVWIESVPYPTRTHPSLGSPGTEDDFCFE